MGYDTIVNFSFDFDENNRISYDKELGQEKFNTHLLFEQKKAIIIDYNNFNFVNFKKMFNEEKDVLKKNLEYIKDFGFDTNFPNILVPQSLENVICDFKKNISMKKTETYSNFVNYTYSKNKFKDLTEKQELEFNEILISYNENYSDLYDLIYVQAYLTFLYFIFNEAYLPTPEKYVRDLSHN